MRDEARMCELLMSFLMDPCSAGSTRALDLGQYDARWVVDVWDPIAESGYIAGGPVWQVTEAGLKFIRMYKEKQSWGTEAK